MGTQMILNEQSIVCRTCLKVLDHVSNTGFTYLDDETSYVKDVGSIREMLQFCIPELDLYVSARPLVCYSCLTILVQVYNFKIKCLSGENIIKDYISRNNLQEYNQVNLNCVLIDDLKMKSQKILSTQIENKIKLLMSEVPDKPESPNLQSSAVVPATIQQTAPMMIITPISVNNSQPKKEVHEEEEEEEEMDETSGETNLTETNETVVEVSEAAVEEAVAVEEEIEKPVKMEVSEPDESMDGDSQDLFDDEDSEDDSADESDDTSQDPTTNPPPPPAETKEESHINTVAVRKDLFDSSQPPPQLIVKEIPKEAPSVILNEGMVAQNGRIVIKIDRKKLQTYKGAEKHQNKEQTKTVISLVEAPSSCSMPKIVSVSSVEEPESSDQQQEETEQEYKCNKCSYETKDVIEMYDHNRRFHSFDYTCQHCPFSTSKVELLGKHMSMVHPQTLTPQKTTINFKVTENYACSLCPFSVKSLDLLRSHHMSAHGRSDGPIILNSAFSESGLRATPRILKRLEYTCDVCPYTTKDKSNLRKHLFTHGTKPLTCDNCSYKCVSPYQLRRHQKQKHGREADPRARNQPYPLPDFKKEKQEALDNFKITLETIKREIEKEMAQSS